MGNFFHDNDDIRFYLERGVDWAPLVAATEHGSRDPDAFTSAADAVPFYREMLEAIGALASDEVAARAAQLDREHPRLVDGEAEEGPAARAIAAAFRGAELHRLCIPRELGGLNVPLLVYFLGSEMIGRGDVATMNHFAFHGGMAMAALAYSIREGTTTFDGVNHRITDTRFRAMIEEIAAGDAWGCMDITEPDAGSDMARLRTRATQAADGSWTLTGQKIFITSGHGKYHFVIARTEDAPTGGDDAMAGLRGLSMFLVPAYEDLPDGTRRRLVTIERIEEKLGHHASVTAALTFDRSPAQLIGKRGEGFAYMLTLMNNARVGVGFESIGLCEAAYRMASAYAAERRSMGKTIARHELIADMLDEMRVDIAALRALAVDAGFHEEMAQKLAMGTHFDPSSESRARVERAQPFHRDRSRRLTPLLKFLAAEKAVECARRAMQIHGGVGYTCDYGAEKLLRDALVLPVYEGTTQIQALMAMKDTLLGMLRRPRRFARRVAAARWTAATSRDPLAQSVARLQSLSLAAQQHLLTRTAAGKLRSLADVPVASWPDRLTKHWDPKRDFAVAMLHAERLARLLTDEAIAEILLEQARRFPERRPLLERFLARAEPRARHLHEVITRGSLHVLADLGVDTGDAAGDTRQAAE